MGSSQELSHLHPYLLSFSEAAVLCAFHPYPLPIEQSRQPFQPVGSFGNLMHKVVGATTVVAAIVGGPATKCLYRR